MTKLDLEKMTEKRLNFVILTLQYCWRSFMRRVSNNVPSCNKMKRFIYINIIKEKNI